MSKNRVGIATLVLLVLLGLTLWRSHEQEVEDTAAPRVEIKLPKIDKDKIDELELTAPDHPKVHLVKKGDEWQLLEPVAAKADQDAVKAAVDQLGKLEVTGVAATKKENHARLEVDEDKATHVIAKSGGKPVLDAYLGVYQTGNSMLRLNGQTNVATVHGSVRYLFTKEPRDWRDRTIAKLDTKQVQQITFDNKNGHFVFARKGDDYEQVVGKHEKPIAPLDASKVKGIVGTASNLNAVEFAEPSVTAEQAGLGQGAATVTVQLSGEGGEQQVLYRLGNENGQNHYLQRDGVDTIYLVSGWVAGRLSPTPDTFVKKEETASNGAPRGSPQNPIQVSPIRAEQVKK